MSVFYDGGGGVGGRGGVGDGGGRDLVGGNDVVVVDANFLPVSVVPYPSRMVKCVPS